jgi:glycosyltransferase involved in cell wall biosynthesis
MKRITIVIPAYNEEHNILPVLSAITVEMQKTKESYSIIVVDDGSTDKTWQIITKARDDFPMLQAIQLSRNFGKEAALVAGLDMAKGDAVIIMDADMQHPPTLIPEMIRLWKSGSVDIVETAKRVRGRESFFYKACSKFLYTMLNRLTATNMNNVSDFCLLDAKVISAWRHIRETNLFFRGILVWLGFRREKIFFDVLPRVRGFSKWTFIQLVKLAITSITAFSSLPLRVVTMLGGLFLLFAAVMGMRAVFLKFYSNVVIDGITTLILLILLVGSLLMIALGIIGEYIARIYDEVKLRPRYIVANQLVDQAPDDFPPK